MKCNLEWLSAYLDGALSEEKRAKLEEHLKTCETCTAKLEEFARVEQVAKKIPAPQLSEAYWENFASRVQNKLTIREKQRTSPGWLEALKGLFQPTTGKLAIAGSVAVIILLTFVSLDQWKKETFRPPVFETEKPVVEGKTDSVQAPAKDEPAFQTAEKDNKAGLVEDKRLDQPAPEKGTATLSQKPAESRPAASAPVGRMLAAPEEQKSKEEPTLAAFAERDEAVKGDTVNVATGKKAEETEKTPLQNRGSLQKQALAASSMEELTQSDKADKRTPLPYESGANTLSISDDTVGKPSVRIGMPSMRKAELITAIRKMIVEKENELAGPASGPKAESLYIFLGDHYFNLYHLSQKRGDRIKGARRINDFLKKEITNSTRQRLLQIQAELKKLKNNNPKATPLPHPDSSLRSE